MTVDEYWGSVAIRDTLIVYNTVGYPINVLLWGKNLNQVGRYTPPAKYDDRVRVSPSASENKAVASTSNEYPVATGISTSSIESIELGASFYAYTVKVVLAE